MIVVTVARRPLGSSNVSLNVIEHGTGAMHIDAARVASQSGEVIGPGSWSDPSKRGGEVGGDLGFSGNDVDKFQKAQAESVERANRLGRWPANLVFEHKPGCHLVGTAVVWMCEDGCPVRDLDGQTGPIPTQRTRTDPGKEAGSAGMFGLVKAQKNGPEYLGETGGASRFFKQIGVAR